MVEQEGSSLCSHIRPDSEGRSIAEVVVVVHWRVDFHLPSDGTSLLANGWGCC